MMHRRRLIAAVAFGLLLGGCSQDTPLDPNSTAESGTPDRVVQPTDKRSNAVNLGAPTHSGLSAASFTSAALAGSVTSIPFAPEPGPFLNRVGGCDDCLFQGLPIGFNFGFYGNTYSTFNLSTNGFISFSPSSSAGCCAGRTIPLDDAINNLVAAAWTDLDSRYGGGVFYETRGRAPTRYLIVTYDQVPWYGGGGTLTTQIILYEGTNNVEVHTTSQPVGHIYTQGTEDATGTQAAFVSGRVAANYGFANDAVRFTGLSASAWTSRTGLPSTRRGFAVAASGGLIYTFGGNNSTGTGTVLNTVQAYSAANNSWTTKTSLPAARQTGNGAVAINGIIYLPGGHDATNAATKTLYAYNTSTNVWTTKAAMPAFSSCGGSAVISGKIYVYSGCTRTSTGAQVASAALYRYDPASNAWATLHAAPASHFQPVVGAIAGKLYVIGGTNSSSVAFGRVDMYDPATNAWTSKATMPTARVGAAGSTLNGKFQVIGGRNGTTYLNTVEAFDPAANSWTTRPSMPTARAALGIGGLSGFLYAIGGRNGSSVLATNERYTP